MAEVLKSNPAGAGLDHGDDEYYSTWNGLNGSALPITSKAIYFTYKPGSREFHALKRGHDLGNDNGNGQGQSSGKGKGNAKNKGNKKGKGKK